ncbi:MAG: hypothetical protein JWO05_3629 [Gemmatimonadetes bacterium]|nr:hypothetical protein [Gemmatimonadota bacterium]
MKSLRMRAIIALLPLALVVLASHRVAAQVGSTTDILVGRVIGPDSQPIAGARIEAMSMETGITKRATTRTDGRYSLLFRDGGGNYRLQVTYLGMAPAKLTVQRRGEDDRIVNDFRMGRTATQLSTVEVKARANAPQGGGAPPPGSIERNLPPQLLERLPVLAGDFAAVATLSPGVVAVAGTDTTANGFSVAGQSASQNKVTVDGASVLFGSLPQDAIRNTKVVTNAYDVSRGQFTGGQVATTTKSGTNLFSGTANYSRRDPSLTFASGPDAGFGQRYGQHVGSAGLGGPIVRDKAFYFLSGQYDTRDDAMASLLDASDATLVGLGTSRDSVNAFLAGLSQKGIGFRNGSPLRRDSRNVSALAKVDYDLADAHSLSVRGDFRSARQSGTRVAPTAVPGTGGSTSARGTGGLATLTSTLGSFLNEARASYSDDAQDGEAYLSAPTGVVSVASSRADGTRGITSLQFGGSGSLPRHARSTLEELANEVSWLSAGGAHRVKLGLLYNRDRSTSGFIPNRYGTFVFNSLADFQADRPALFARTLSGQDQSSGSDNEAVYIGDTWRRSASLQVTYGTRIERSTLPGAPAENPGVLAAFGRSTAYFPSSGRVSPRIGFSYLLGNTIGIPKGFLRGGVGEFRGRVLSQLVGAVRNGTGLASSQGQLACVGSDTPVPAWSSYFADTASIPSSCLNGAAGMSGAADGTRNVALFDRSFAAPRVWRASLGGARFFSKGSISLEGTVLRGLDNPGVTDINLVSAPRMSLSDEHRVVYAGPSDIVPQTGAVSLAASRQHAAFGAVSSIGSMMESETAQGSVNLSGNVFRRVYGVVSYTYTRSRDQANGYSIGGYLPTTSGNPNLVEWGTSDLERRHAIISILNIPVRTGVELGFVTRLTSGGAYTPLVNGDVNGDGARNDRAFVFAPSAAPDTALRNGMQRLYGATDARARSCLMRQEGTIATRNSCALPWTTSFDLQLTTRPEAFGLKQRLTLSLQAINTLAAVDQLLHGADALRGWGQAAIPDRTLLLARGFDPQEKRFQYQVNEHFGSSAGARSAFRTPFQLVLQARMLLGHDPAQNPLASADGKALSVADWKARLVNQVPNPMKLLLDQADSLQLSLTPLQVARLTTLNDALTTHLDSVVTAIATMLSAAGPRPDPGAIAPKIQAQNMILIKAIQDAVGDIRKNLTEAQWAKLPERIRLPLAPPAPKKPGG